MGGIVPPRLSRVPDAALRHLRCPLCGGALDRAGVSVRCPRGHSFDVARQGYLGLLPGDALQGTADTAAMVEARTRVLAAGHFEAPAAGLEAVCERELSAGRPGCVVDVGAGTGWHLARVLGRAADRIGIALDLSKPALRRAARSHERITAVAADAWAALPLGDG